MFRSAFWRFLTPVLFAPDGDGGAGGGNGNTGDGGGAGDKRFTQAELDDILKRRLADERAANERRMRELGVSGKDKEELERLRNEAADRARKDLEEKGRYDAALKSKDEEFARERETFTARTTRLTNKLRERTITAELVSAAAGAGALDPSEVAQILSGRIRLTDDFEPEVLDAHGQPAFKAGRPLTIAEMVQQYLDEKPHHRKPAETGAAGAKGGKTTDAEGAAEGAPTAEIAKLEADLKAADEKAQKSRSAADVTRAHQIKRKLEAARKALAKK